MKALYLLALLWLAAPAAGHPRPMTQVDIGPADGGAWFVHYKLAAPTTALRFVVTPDASRGQVWRPEPDFKLIQEDGADVLERSDGRAFQEVRVTMPAEYRLLPNGYPPFSPFSDGGLLVHTGQFFACPQSCGDGEAWRFAMRLPEGVKVVIDGERRSGMVGWTDAGPGKEIYLGKSTGMQTPDFIGVIDPALPPAIRTSLVTSMPSFMHFFATRLGAPKQKPMLYAAYSPTYGHGFGSQGGSLPGEVFMFLYGDPNGKGMEVLPDLLTWHFAHEASHLFQHGVTMSDQYAWIHEGAAEASAALAMLAASPENRAYVERRIADARKRCAVGLKDLTLEAAPAAHKFALNYDCGLILQMRFDAAIRKKSAESDGLFALWRSYRTRVQKGEPGGEDTYLQAVADLAGSDVAQWARTIINTRLDDPVAALAEPA